MEQTKQTIDELTEDFHRHLRKIRRSEKTIRLYLAAWEKLKAYMALHKQKVYNSKIGEAFLISELGQYKYENLPTNRQNFVSKIEALADFQNTGKVLLGKRIKASKVFTGTVGKTMKAFIDFRTRLYSLSILTINNYEIYLYSLLCFLYDRDIRTVNKITRQQFCNLLINSILQNQRQGM
jgi:hypothetical protein